MTRTAVERRIAADPASVALLLTAPPSEPGPDDAPQVASDPPVRSPLGFTATVRVARAGDLLAVGQLTIAHAGDEPRSTRARLAVEQYTDLVLLPLLDSWLEGLAVTAEHRADAA
jgi:hypothetical protein